MEKEQLNHINRIRKELGISTKLEDKEKGVRGSEGFLWGFPDGYDDLSNEWTLYYEIENRQNHPDTNILKYWPILEGNSSKKIILIQWYLQKSKYINRWELAKFIADKIESHVGSRFKYFVTENEIEFETKLSEVRSLLGQLK